MASPRARGLVAASSNAIAGLVLSCVQALGGRLGEESDEGCGRSLPERQ